MKAKFTIHIDIDAPIHRATGWAQGQGNTHEIVIRRDDHAPFTKLSSCLIHELGHVVGRILKLPGQMNDPRQHSNIAESRYGSTLLPCEKEAWRVGRQFLRRFAQDEKACLETYK